MTPSFPWLVGIWLGAAALLTILYLVRERRPRVYVPFLDLFFGPAELTRRESWRGRLRRPGSLLLQLLLLLLLACSLAECSRRLSRKGETLILLVDTSATMGVSAASPGSSRPKESALERAKERARAWLGGVEPEGEVVIIEVSAMPEIVLGRTRDLERARQVVDGLRVKKSTANVSRALELAQQMDSGGPTRTVVLSDTNWGADLGPSVILDRVARVALEENVRIRSFAARRSPSGAGQFEVTYELAFQGPEAATALVEVERLDASGASAGIVDARELRLAPGEVQRGEFRELSGVERALRLTVRLLGPKPEEFLVDNVAFAVLAEERSVRVLCVGPESLYLKAALLSVIKSQVAEVPASGYPLRTSEGRVEPFDLTIFVGEAPSRWRETGAAIYLGASGPHLPVSSGRPLKMFGFDEFVRDAQVFRYFDPYETMVLRGSSLLPRATDRVLGSSAGGPILVRGERDEGPFLSLGFAPEASDFVLRPAFPLFIRGAIEELLGSDKDVWLPSLELGRVLKVDAPKGSGPFVELRGPLRGEGFVHVRRERLRSEALELEFEEPGIYELRSDGAPSRWLAVNLGAREERLPPKAETSGPIVIPSRSVWWKWALGLAFGLGLFEFVAFYRRWTA